MTPTLWPRIVWFGTGALCAGVVALIAGMAIGSRDVQLQLAAQRIDAAAACGSALPMVIVRDPLRPERDRWSCARGSLRMEPR
jgi:hypothetical protein